MLAGDGGEPVRRALEMQVEVGRFFGARRMVPVASAHAAGDAWIMGDAGLSYLEQAAEQGARFRIPITYNPCSVDFENWQRFGQPAEHVEKERRVGAALQQMGMVMSMTCINYQSVSPPRFGEHLAWGDTGTVIFANSVVGARSNYEGGPAAVSAGLTGRVPEYGFHLAEQRRGTLLVELRFQPRDWADWGALGCWLGRRITNYWEVPVIVGEGLAPGVDDLKHLGASLASYGSFAMFHLVGITPEAPSAEAALGGRPPAQKLVVTSEGLEEVYASFQPAGSHADLVVFSAPQLGIHEIQRIARWLEGRRVHPQTQLILTMSPQIKAEAVRNGFAATIEQAGGLLSAGVCFYVMTPELMREKHGWRTLVTNSAKLANIIEGAGYNPVLRPTEVCLEAACSGEIH